MIVKCKISRYDPNITKPPFKTIKITECEVDKPDIGDPDGVEFFVRLRNKCLDLGYKIRFYSITSIPYDYEIVVN